MPFTTTINPMCNALGPGCRKPCLLRQWSVRGHDRHCLYCASDISCTRLSTTCHTPSTFTKKSIFDLHIVIPNILYFWDREVGVSHSPAIAKIRHHCIPGSQIYRQVLCPVLPTKSSRKQKLHDNMTAAPRARCALNSSLIHPQ